MKQTNEALPNNVTEPASEGANICITGVQTPMTETNIHKALIDWCSFTLSVDEPETEANKIAMKLFPGEKWSSSQMYGFEAGLKFENTRIMWNTRRSRIVHVEIKGSACRLLEKRGVIVNWPGFIGEWRKVGANFTRLDLAIDDKAGLLNLNIIRDAAIQNSIVSRLKQDRPEIIYDRSKGGQKISDGHVFGSKNSETQIRFYDKSLQMKQQGHWVRCEIQFRDVRANMFADLLVNDGMNIVSSVIYSYLDFKQPATNARRDRWDTASWWVTFLDYATKVSLGTEPRDTTLERARANIERLAPSLAMLDIAYGREWILELLNDGYARLGPYHVRLLKDFQFSST